MENKDMYDKNKNKFHLPPYIRFLMNTEYDDNKVKFAKFGVHASK